MTTEKKNENLVKLILPTKEFDLLAKMADEQGKSPDEMVQQIVRENCSTGNKVVLQFTKPEFALIADAAKTNDKTPGQMLNQMVREKCFNEKQDPATFEENGVTYERLQIDLPKGVVDYYRFLAHINNTFPESLIAKDALDQIRSEVEGSDPSQWKETLGLTVLDKMAT